MIKGVQQIVEGESFDVVRAIRGLSEVVVGLEKRLNQLEQVPQNNGEAIHSNGKLESIVPSADLDAGGQGADLDRLLPERVAKALRRAGLDTIEAIAGASDEVLQKIGGIGPSTLEQIRVVVPRRE